MPKTHKWADIKRARSPEGRARIEADVAQMEAEMPLHRVREAFGLTQAQIAQQIGLSQPSVAQLEQRSDVLIGTLRRYIEAMKGELVIIARFGDQETTISLDQLERGTTTPSRKQRKS